MTTKLILIDTDTHVVVPRKTDLKQLENCGPIEGYDCDRTTADKDHSVWYEAMLQEVQQPTTPPVLRWEGSSLKFMGMELAYVSIIYGVWQPHLMAKVNMYHPLFAEGTEQEAHRAAEKALGFPDGLIIEDV